MAFLKRITPYAIAVLLLAVFYVRVPLPLRKTDYQYLMFVVQWPFAVCADREYCTYDPLPNNFTIHGIWPANFSGARLNCTGKCFNLREMDKEQKLQKDLQVSWPDLERNNNMSFWSHEYNDHGRCCDNIFNQKIYFKTADKMWREHNVKKMFEDDGCSPGNWYEPTKLKDAVRRKTAVEPALRCHKDNPNLLREVVICYNPNGTKVIHCPKPANTCNGTGTILWKGPPKDV